MSSLSRKENAVEAQNGRGVCRRVAPVMKKLASASQYDMDRPAVGRLPTATRVGTASNHPVRGLRDSEVTKCNYGFFNIFPAVFSEPPVHVAA